MILINYKNIPLTVKHSPGDNRDYTLKTFGVDINTENEDDYTVPHLPNVYSQGNSGECLYFSIAGIKESQELEERGVRVRYSPSYLYAIREEDDYKGEGGHPREALKMAQKFGICEFDDFPYVGTYIEAKNLLDKRFVELLPKALPQRIKSYGRLDINNIDEVKTAIKKFGVCVISIEVFGSFFKTGADGIVTQVNIGEKSYGGHAMELVGWKKINGQLHWKVLNSWDKSWGDNGYCYIPRNYSCLLYTSPSPRD